MSNRKDELYHYGVKGMKWGVTKAEYKQMDKQQRKAAKQEYNTYMNKMDKYGRPHSESDKKSGGQSTKLYNEIKAKKGKVYADSVVESLGKKYTRDLISDTVAAGALAVAASIYITKRLNDKSWEDWARYQGF